jgi:hypothetical protein
MKRACVWRRPLPHARSMPPCQLVVTVPAPVNRREPTFPTGPLAEISSGLDSDSAGFHGSATNGSGSGGSLERE